MEIGEIKRNIDGYVADAGAGNGNLTIEEQRTHFAAWVFMKSPILLGTDVCSFLPRALKRLP